ncbi:Uncharacterised protein [Mycoplasmoides pneumoniae]|uniref:Uncharacterized protein n=1 Tax=Mycoplasmoides pneumoniae TaxID=2104 RepID=A0AB38W5Z1_MYCPM|nr:Uncharacterised protein [Mycoplasmoides pneumoniae]
MLKASSLLFFRGVQRNSYAKPQACLEERVVAK